MTTALYRRYRPDTFEDVIGQEHVTQALQTALASGRVAHAFLFSGPRGCGKTTSARIMARALNCAKGPTPTPCGECPSCIDLASGGSGSLDVTEIDAASNRGVEAAAQLRERLIVAPSRDRYRIFILDEAHMVTTEGFNALLKVVEEPPEHVKFIFATTAPEKVLATIRSRTHHYPFRLVGPEVLVPYLHTITEREGVTLDEAVYPLVVRSGGGSVRDSLSVLDQLIAGSDGHVTSKRAIELLGYTDTVLLDRTVDALGDSDGAEVFRIIEEVVGAGQEPRRFVEDLLQRLRDLMVCALAGDRAADILVEVPSDQLLVMHQQAARWGPPLLSRRADVVEKALADMYGATSPRLQLELLMARLLVSEPGGRVQGASASVASSAPVTPAPTSAVTTGTRASATDPTTVAPTSVPGREQGEATVTPRAQSPAAAPTSQPAPTSAQPPSPTAAPVPSAPAPVPGVPSTDDVRSRWPAIISQIGNFGAALPALIKTTRRVEPVGGHVYFFLMEPSSAQRFRMVGGEEHLSKVLSSVFGRQVSGRVAAQAEADDIVAGRISREGEGEGEVGPATRAPAPQQPAVQPSFAQSVAPVPSAASQQSAVRPSVAQPVTSVPVTGSASGPASGPTPTPAPAPTAGPAPVPEPAPTPMGRIATEPAPTPKEEARAEEARVGETRREESRADEARAVEPRREQPRAAQTPSPNSYRGRSAAEMVLDILGGTVMSEKIVDASPVPEYDGPELVEPDPNEISELDLEVGL